ncbi:outer membrane protein [Martelella soudanensis]|uniref:outer membrane protein n=1 Tax=unclassified Martelella TaxID=2629616 RepID=UPI0015DFCEFF|nr:MULTISPECIES: outer membrane protein [unclassified Martelella]
MRKLSASLLALYGASCLPAVAADLALRPPIQPVAYQEVYIEEEPQWDGPYAGLSGGYSWTGGRGTISGGGTQGLNYNGAIASLFAGYNKQLGSNVVVGVEGDADYSWGKREIPTGLGFNGEIGSNWSGTLRGRVGYAFGDALVYVTGGAAVANAYIRAMDISISDTVYGYTVGAGLDYAFTDNVFGRLEYRYTGYPDQEVVKDLASLAGGTAKFKMHSHAVTAGVGVKF